jgi:hypothetical protein
MVSMIAIDSDGVDDRHRLGFVWVGDVAKYGKLFGTAVRARAGAPRYGRGRPSRKILEVVQVSVSAAGFLVRLQIL